VIKVNLATRKQSSMSNVAIDDKAAGFKKKFDFKLDLRNINVGDIGSGVAGLPIKRLIFLIVAGTAGFYMLGNYKDTKIAEKEAELAKLKAEQKHIAEELDKTKGLETIKASMDADAATLKTKIDVITKLLDGRQDPPKTLVALANGIPAEVWLSDFSVKGDSVSLKGSSVDFDKVTELYKNLQENVFFTDVRLVDSHEAKDGGRSIAQFELVTKRK
jgi:Tfp pilus assembly protein PilN